MYKKIYLESKEYICVGMTNTDNKVVKNAKQTAVRILKVID